MSNPMDVLVKRSALAQTKLVPAANAALEEGDARLRVDLFSLTANNVTYGAVGDFLKYWQFYPAPDDWGRVPVWGFATVVQSRSPNVKVGERVYGYLPMSSEFTLRPGVRRHGGFLDESPHRAGLSPIYNNYVLNEEDGLYTPDSLALQALFRPLFTTSFLIDDFIADNGYFGASQVIFSSASAKTAYAAAQLLKTRGAKVVGLTSASNVAFVQRLGFYDKVLSYDAIRTLDGSVPSVFVDIAGDSAVRAAVHETFRDNLKYSCAVGATHWDVPRTEASLPGPQPQMFFAPGIVQKRIAEWGAPEFHRRIGEAWRAFLPTAARTTNIIESHGLAAAAQIFADLASGRTRPEDGHVIRLNP
jgi:NADPH:quinone reductase-like Zn-dependent oxidoreductase